MAVRDDFTAGEVLAAADLNDTFAEKVPFAYGTATPTTTVEGFVWYDENNTPPTPKFWDGSAFQSVGGLSFVSDINATAVGSLNINNIFTSSFTNYRIWVSVNLGTSAQLRLRTRAAGSDITTSDYHSSYLQYRTDTDGTIFSRINGGTRAETAATSGILRGFLDFSFPISATGSFAGQIVDSGTNYPALWGCRLPATAADGISLIASTGTATFRVLVYGYQGF
jgi:hypothetical protein